MSWLSNLTSKAEAMLVKLDHDTAKAIQNPDQIFKQVPKIFDGSREDTAVPSDDTRQDQPLLSGSLELGPEIAKTNAQPHIQERSHQADTIVESNLSLDSEHNGHQEQLIDTTQRNLHEEGTHESQSQAPAETNRPPEVSQRGTHQTSNKNHPNQASRFKLQTTKLRQPLWDQSPREAGALSIDGSNGRQQAQTLTTLVSPGVNDIRASINRSLQEYSQSSSTYYTRHRDQNDDQTLYTSHFDNQPNLIGHSPSSGSDYDEATGRLHSSPSFSIDVPSAQGTDITHKIFRQNGLDKKSPFNLHKVINKLSSQKIQSQSLVSDKTKIRLRRAQMRVASHFRRLNYYFRTHPSMKYWMLGYLVLLQLLVIYVLFFYQSSGSNNYLAKQVEQQQEEFVEFIKSNSEKVPS